MSAFTSPFIIKSDGSSYASDRLDLSPRGQSIYDERWLQGLLFQHINSIPVKEIDPHIGKLIPICMELETGAGPADILCITPSGQIVLIETKLWRNSEARRAVVAQILDYAKQLTTWSYEDLARQAAMASKQGPTYLLSTVKKAVPDLDEASFVDGINRSLRLGDFLLLIVGDGIRYGAEALVGFIERYGNMRFGLGLIEVASYCLPDNSILLQPRILAKTELIKRTIYISGQADEVEVVEDLKDEWANEFNKKQAQDNAIWLEKFWSEYLKILRLDDAQQPVPTKCKSTNIAFYQPPSGSKAWITCFLARSSNEGGVFLTFSKNFSPAREFYEELHAQREEIENIVPGLTWKADLDGKVIISSPKITLNDLNDPANRVVVIEKLAILTNGMVNAFRNRLEKISKDRGDI